MIYAVNSKTLEHVRVPYSLDGDATWSYIEADADGWIPWEGGACPVPDGSPCEVRFRWGSDHQNSLPEEWSWSAEGNALPIIAYRPVLDAKPEAPAWGGSGLPPVGARVRIRIAEGDRGCADVVAHHNNGVVVWQHSDMEYRRWNPEFLHPIRSEEDEAVEAMLGRTRCTVPEEHARMICRDLYRDGYRKEPDHV